jgi:membrane-bound lytic murein transglycosylase D
MVRALGSAAGQITVMRRVMEEQHLPPDLSYMPVVESALEPPSHSRAGAAGLWQLTPATAKIYGLRVGDGIDERVNTVKSTQAACHYLRDLILDFGSGSSVMLALAAYNLGPSRVKQAIVKEVADPIKQRNFWYLYRVKALPLETREYVPKVVAAMIIARDSSRYGF